MSKIQCLTCGGMTDTGDSLTGTCEYCGCAISLKRISAFSCMETADLLKTRKALEKSDDSEIENRDLALALCYMKTGNFSLAKKKLEQVMDDSPECCEGYYYYSIALLNGRRLSDLSLREARQIAEFLNTAVSLDDSFLFPKLLYALICIEYYAANDLTPPHDGYAILAEIGSEFNAGEMTFFKGTVKTGLI